MTSKSNIFENCNVLKYQTKLYDIMHLLIFIFVALPSVIHGTINESHGKEKGAYCKNLSGITVSPSVNKNTLIRVKESLRNGAKEIGSEIVEDATECYNLCCGRYDSDGCNVAQMHYKDDTNELGEDIILKYCYLFACQKPSVCVFNSSMTRYHVIALNSPENKVSVVESLSTTTTTKKTDVFTTSTPQPTTTTATSSTETTDKVFPSQQEEEKCPPGSPVAMCSDNPCEVNKCAGDLSAVCQPSFCGGCHAKFYTKNGDLADCSKPAMNKDSTANHNEQSLVVNAGDYEEEKLEVFPPVASIKVKKEMKKKEGDEYYQTDRRTWEDKDGGDGVIDGYAKTPRSTESTSPHRVIESNKMAKYNSYFSIPLLIALLVCIALLLLVLYRYRCSRRGKTKKFPVDDGDYLINGMYL